MNDIDLTEIESDITNRIIVVRRDGFYKPHDDGTIRYFMKSEICNEYFGIVRGRKIMHTEDGNEKTFYGCFKEEEIIWSAGFGCDGCPIHKKLEKFYCS
jgi:hypothetical protein